MNFRGPKVKIARALDLPLTPKAARIMDRRPHPPGQHGATPRRKVSEYKRQLLEKQRLRAQYAIGERQLRNAFLAAAAAGGNAGETLLQSLELRLDAVVLRAGFARTIFAARQYVGHGHVLVNGQRCDIRSRRLEPGDKVEVREKSRGLACFAIAVSGAGPSPAYLDVDRDALTVRVREVPLRAQIPVLCETSLVVEFYSR